jgi:hypothetical protein
MRLFHSRRETGQKDDRHVHDPALTGAVRERQQEYISRSNRVTLAANRCAFYVWESEGRSRLQRSAKKER